MEVSPQPVWLSWLGMVASSIPARVHAWVAGLVPGWGAYGQQPIDDVSLLPFPL